MRLLPLLRSLAFGLVLGYAGWQGAEYVVHAGRPGRLFEQAIATAPSEPISGLTAVFLFRPDECPQVMGTLDLLNDLAARDIRVVGALMVDEYRMPDWRALIEAEQIRFPVYRVDPGKARAAVSSIGYPGGPLLILFDQEGRLVLATDVLRAPGLKALIDDLTRRLTQVDRRRLRA